MVVFTCNHCGETLHKPKVEKHYQFTCRNYKSVTCVDCFKDFRNEEYVGHTKCVTEDERYAAKGTYKNGIVKKGEVKQESWLDMIKLICDTEKNLKPSLRNLLNTISEYNNVPRKKQKFMNFIKSSSGNRADMKEVEEVWDIIEKYKSKNNLNKQNNEKHANNKLEINDKEQKNGTTESEKTSKKRSIENVEDTKIESPKKKKKKSVEEIAVESSRENMENTKNKNKHKLKPFKGTKDIFVEGNQNTESETLENSKKKHKIPDSSLETSIKSSETLKNLAETSKFNFKEKILDILKEKHSISHRKLQKKILKAYLGLTGENDCEEKVIRKFNKKLKKIPNVGIENDTVILQ